jgi:hypothetical protein
MVFRGIDLKVSKDTAHSGSGSSRTTNGSGKLWNVRERTRKIEARVAFGVGSGFDPSQPTIAMEIWKPASLKAMPPQLNTA